MGASYNSSGYGTPRGNTRQPSDMSQTPSPTGTPVNTRTPTGGGRLPQSWAGEPNQGGTGQYSTNPTLANGLNPQQTPTTGGYTPQGGWWQTHDAANAGPMGPQTPQQQQATAGLLSTADQFRRALGLGRSDRGSAIMPDQSGMVLDTAVASGQQPSGGYNTNGQAQVTGNPATPVATTPPPATPAGPPTAPQTPTPPPTAEQVWQSLASVTTPTQWTAPPEGMFTSPSTPDSSTLLRIGQNGPSINPTQVQNIMNGRGTQAAMDVLRQDLAYQSPAAQLANAVRQQQTSAAALPQMTQDLRNVPQLYANPVTRALLPENIRRAEETRLNGGPDWRTASFGDAIDGNQVTRAVPTSDFRAPTGSAPTLTPAQQQSNLVADFVNSWLPNMNNPGARGLAQTYDVDQLNSALSSSPEWRQAMVANRLTGLNPQQLQVALTTSGLTLPQFLAQAVSRLAG